MKIIISPSKEKKIKSYKYQERTPLFIEKTKSLVSEINKLDLEQIKIAYNCSDKIAEKVKQDFSNFDKIKHPALSFYNGLQYKYLDIESLNADDIQFLINNVYIIDALYGVLRANDLISEYRLDYHTKLSFFNKNYYKEEVNSIINKKVINLCSREYSSIVDKEKLFSINFVQNKNGKIKSYSTDTKIARGLFIKYLAKIKSSDISKLKEFNLDGYKLTKESDVGLTFEKK